MQPIIDHIHITVEDLERAEKFYDGFLPLLGFDLSLKEHDCVDEHDYRIIEYHSSSLSIGLINCRTSFKEEKINRRKPGSLHHMAFRVNSPAKVDALYEQIKALGAPIVHAPQLYPEYCCDYYAFFFKDSEGIEYEIVSFAREQYFPKDL